MHGKSGSVHNSCYESILGSGLIDVSPPVFRGCRALRADTLRTLKIRLPEAVAEVRADSAAFKDLYRFTFRFGLEGGQKTLPVEMAVSLWLLVFSNNEPPLLSRWIRFLQGSRVWIGGNGHGLG